MVFVRVLLQGVLAYLLQRIAQRGLLGQLAEAGVLKTSKAVVVTTRSVEAEMIKAMELGAVDYITKPVSLPVLMRRLRSALAGGPGVA